ncbi:MAG: 6-phosphogluconate dehydrogenase [Flavobacteriaceae bacterium]|nr:6-phosphogluconate dehydrogenase [Flavobacteriaceae bacterium]
MKKILSMILLAAVVISAVYLVFVYFVPYSEGTRTGELIKYSKKGVIFKTWEGEISQGISGAEIFTFSVRNKDVIENLKNLEGYYVKLEYKELYNSFFYWGDTKYFITGAEKAESPHLNRKK